ncbi:ribonuclease H [Senna tora]|uniref:Ribonuclease H n=1 Tax=Senna tora TaxID=362788 RepID=A0A834X9D6_9FABA|nr:ribonuclease H [Senna tora]
MECEGGLSCIPHDEEPPDPGEEDMMEDSDNETCVPSTFQREEDIRQVEQVVEMMEPMRAGRAGPLISHLLFVDDIILFGEATLNQMKVVKQCLDVFGEVAGQKVNGSKTHVFFSKNTREDVRQDIQNFSGFLATNNLGKVPGITLAKSVISAVGSGWDISALHTVLEESAVQMVLNEMPPNPRRGADSICWGTSGDGKFSVKEAYKSLIGSCGANGGWNWIWRINVPERIRVFIWQMMHHRLPTKDRVQRWSGRSPHCDWCTNQVEDTLHALRDCYFAARVWSLLVKPSALAGFFHSGFSDWVKFNKDENIAVYDGVEWLQVWAVGVWMLWNWRNRAIFCDDFVRPKHPHLSIIEFVKEISSASDVYQSDRSPCIRVEKLVAWEKPRVGWVKVNSDGAVKQDVDSAGCGAILRDHSGRWLGGVIRSLGSASVLKAEAWGAFEGLALARDLGFRKVCWEADSKVLVDSVLSNGLVGADLHSIIQEIRLALASFDLVEVRHRWREANCCANFLANLGCFCSSGRCKLSEPPVGLANLLLADVVGIHVPRLVAL